MQQHLPAVLLCLFAVLAGLDLGCQAKSMKTKSKPKQARIAAYKQGQNLSLRLNKLEKTAFGQITMDDSVLARLNKLEKAINGRSEPGTFILRIENLEKLLGIAENMPPLAPALANQKRPPTNFSSSITLMLKEAVSRHESGSKEEAETLFQRVLVLDPKNTDAAFSLAALAEERGDWGAALSFYESVSNLEPLNKEAKLAIEEMQRRIETSNIHPFQNPFRNEPDNSSPLGALALEPGFRNLAPAGSTPLLTAQASQFNAKALQSQQNLQTNTAQAVANSAQLAAGAANNNSRGGTFRRAIMNRNTAAMVLSTALSAAPIGGGLRCPLCRILRGW